MSNLAFYGWDKSTLCVSYTAVAALDSKMIVSLRPSKYIISLTFETLVCGNKVDPLLLVYTFQYLYNFANF